MAKLPIFALICICIVRQIFGQENADTNVAKSLRECYNNTEYIDSNMKRPMSINYLIDLIRKVENGPDRMDLQKLSTSLLHRFRQDGILRSTNVKDLTILPFSPYGDETEKFKILLQKIVPNSYLFPNDTLTPMQRCAIHLMLSESVETRERGDESTVCNKKEKYRLRMARSIQMPKDVEIVEGGTRKKSSKGQMQVNPNEQVSIIGRKHTVDPVTSESLCPLEYGVVYTKWGAVSAGSVIAGIAAGSEHQIIDVHREFGTDKEVLLDSIWGATLAGNIAEAGYLSKGNNRDVDIGADGGWYSAQVPHGYYVSKTDNLYFTDAEIRGDLDGLILGTRMKDYMKNARNMKLSQLLDMYYSERGLFSENIKACKRQELLTVYANGDEVKKQGFAFALILNKKVTARNTIFENSVLEAVTDAANKFSTYVPANLRDLSCLNNNDYQVIKTDIIIVLDFEWQFEVAEAAMAQLLDNIDINPYNSNYTIVNAKTGEQIFNSSNSIADFYETFNKTFYDTQSKGFDINVAMQTLERIGLDKIERERRNNELRSRSSIGLFFTSNPSISTSQKDYIIKKMDNVIKPKLPDLKILVLTAGAKEIFTNIVKDPAKDIITMQDSITSDNIVESISQLVTRIKQIPAKIISYKCTSQWIEEGDEKSIIEYIEPKSINYYRVSPNYFYKNGNTRIIKIKGQGLGVLSVCHSRGIELPRSSGGTSVNNTQDSSAGSSSSSEVSCKQITSEEFAIELSNPCSDSNTIGECPPLYFSVEAKENRGESRETCLDKNCRYTDNSKFTISVENFGCFSSGNILLKNVFVLISMLYIVFVRNSFK